ncbi:MAG: translesion DNA synthesis-associated protein ImuA [Pseudomonadales bacterium]
MPSLPSQQTLAALLQHPALWQAGQSGARSDDGNTVLSSGYEALDKALHMGGWPRTGNTELLCDHSGIGEMSLLMPALSQQLQNEPSRWLALVAPPHIPYAPALAGQNINLQRLLVVQAHSLADKLWASEQLLRCGHFAAVLNWLDDRKFSYANKRKLQLAAQEGHSWGISFQPSAFSQQSSPAKLRLQLLVTKKQLKVDILKQQGGWAGQQILLPRPERLIQNTLHVDDWDSNKHVVVSHPFTLTAAGGLHSQQHRTIAMRGYSKSARQLRQRASLEGRRSDQQLTQYSSGSEPATQNL